MTTIGIIGAGNIGTAVARQALAHGYEVVISNSRGPETLTELVAELGDGARAATAPEAAAAGDFVLVAIPLKNVDDLPADELAGKVVLDANNYYWERDGRIPELDEARTTTSELVQAQLPGATVVKAFNQIVADQIGTDGRPAGTADRRALAIAGDDDAAKALVTTLYDEFGFDTIDVGSLSESWRVERDQPAYVVRQNADELRANLARAERVTEQ